MNFRFSNHAIERINERFPGVTVEDLQSIASSVKPLSVQKLVKECMIRGIPIRVNPRAKYFRDEGTGIVFCCDTIQNGDMLVITVIKSNKPKKPKRARCDDLGDSDI